MEDKRTKEENPKSGPNKKQIEILIDDKSGRGGIAIERTDIGFHVWLEMTDLGQDQWEWASTHSTLAAAMLELSDIIETNCRHDFYEE